MSNSVHFESHLGEFENALPEKLEKAMREIGMNAETAAKQLAPYDTGLLRNSITYAISGQGAATPNYSADNGGGSGSYSGTAPGGSKDEVSLYLGTNVEYAPYIELGHTSRGGKKIPAHEFIRPAIEDHIGEYKRIIEAELKR